MKLVQTRPEIFILSKCFMQESKNGTETKEKIAGSRYYLGQLLARTSLESKKILSSTNCVPHQTELSLN